MKDSVRRFVMLCIIVTCGLFLTLFDVTLIQLLFMLVLLVILLPFLLGIATVEEIRGKMASIKKIGFLKRLDEIKFFEKKKGAKETRAAPPKPAKPEPKKADSKKTGLGARFSTLVASLKSLPSILQQKTKGGKKVEDINRMLDKTVSEKVSKGAPAPTAAAAGGGASLPAPGGAGGMPADGSAADPFLALSEDEFDAGLLDGLDDDSGPEMPDEIKPEGPAGGASAELPKPELSIPPAEAGDGGLDQFSGLDGEKSAMDDELGDLDSVSLDSLEIDEDLGGEAPADQAAAAETPAPAAGGAGAPAAAAKPTPTEINTAWIASDAPVTENPEDQLGLQSDMASFAGGATTSDEDLLSSIASDVKTVKKEKDLSLLRELKDFKAPASDIEDELKGMFEQIGSAQDKIKAKKKTPDNEQQ